MKIMIIGAKGTIGKRVTAALAAEHEIVQASRSGGDYQLDLEASASIEAMYTAHPDLDAVVCIAGEAKWDFMDNMADVDYDIGYRSKLMGQVHLVRIGKKHLKPGASITLSTGILADDPVPMTTSAAMVNGAIHSFAKAAVLELEKGHRLNVVCSGLVEDSAIKYKDYFPGHTPVPMPKVVNAYLKSILGKNTGEIIRVNA